MQKNFGIEIKIKSAYRTQEYQNFYLITMSKLMAEKLQKPNQQFQAIPNIIWEQQWIL